MKDVSRVVAYNADFDYNVIMAEAYRVKAKGLIATLKTKKIVCAMKFAKNKLKVSHIKLIELYRRLFDKNAEQKHRALFDVHMTAECLFKLNKM